jgi:hypothetical protein
MLQALLRYLGLDAESKRQRAETKERLDRANSQLDLLQKKLEETSQNSLKEQKAIHKTLSQGGSRG